MHTHGNVCVDCASLCVELAIGFLSREASSRALCRRFEREARIAHRIPIILLIQLSFKVHRRKCR